MQEKVQEKKQRTKAAQESIVVDKIEVEIEVDVKPKSKAKEKEKDKPILFGVATTDLIVDGKAVQQGEQIDILEDKGDEWLTDKGLVSKLFLLLKKTN